nr:unnamed protein product [Spirometra erinaceieuropaei]
MRLDLHIGSSPTQMYRIARTYHEHPLTYLDAAARLDFRRLWHRLFSNGGLRNHAVNIFKDYELRLNYHPDFVEVPLSSVNFFTNARALASLLTYLLPNPGSNPLFSESTLQWMLSPGSVVHDDPVLQRSVQYTKSGLFIESSPEGKPIFGLRDDILGQVAFVDPSRNLTFAYVTNHAHGCSVQRDWILKTLIQGIYACL